MFPCAFSGLFSAKFLCFSLFFGFAPSLLFPVFVGCQVFVLWNSALFNESSLLVFFQPAMSLGFELFSQTFKLCFWCLSVKVLLMIIFL